MQTVWNIATEHVWTQWTVWIDRSSECSRPWGIGHNTTTRVHYCQNGSSVFPELFTYWFYLIFYWLNSNLVHATWPLTTDHWQNIRVSAQKKKPSNMQNQILRRLSRRRCRNGLKMISVLSIEKFVPKRRNIGGALNGELCNKNCINYLV